MSETIFSEKATKYSKGRFGYAPEAIDRMFSSFIKPGEAVADIGSGTGILSREFINHDIDVYCIEPDDNMRHIAEKTLSSNKYFHSIAAKAENTGLADGSVSLVTCASSFHWFNHMAFRSECLRILQPKGKVCILINARNSDNELTIKQHKLCSDYCPGYISLCHGYNETRMRVSDFFSYEPEHTEYPFMINYTNEEFLARCLSSSYSLTENDNDYISYIEKLQDLITEYSVRGKICTQNMTHMFLGEMYQSV